MLNLLMYSEDTLLSEKISSCLFEYNTHFKLLHVTSDEVNLIKLMQSSHFDVLILITDNPDFINIFEYLEQFNVENYLNSIIVISNNLKLKTLLKRNRFLAKFLNKQVTPQALSKQISNVITDKYSGSTKLKSKIAHELYSIGFKPYHKGTNFMIESIYLVYQKEAHLCDNFERNIYPYVAEKFHTNSSNVKSDIIKSINSMYAECELNKLKSYFHFNTDFKPTTKMIIYTIISNIA